MKSWLPGLGVLLILQWLIEFQSKAIASSIDIVTWSTYGLLALGFAMAVHFNRAFYAHATILLAIQHYLIQTYLQTALDSSTMQALYLGQSLWFALTISVLALIPTKPALHGMQALISLGYSIPVVLLVTQLSSVSDWYLAMSQKGVFPEWLLVLKPLTWSVASYFLGGVLLVFFLITTLTAFYGRASFAVPILILGNLVLAVRFQVENESTLILLASALVLMVYLLRQSWQMVYLDELTGLPGRRAMNETMQGLGRTYSIAMMDVDHFKKFNDTYGHDIGDQVLKMVAARIGEVTGGGKPFRYGGEEFAVIFPGKTVEQTLVHLESVRTMIEHYTMTLRDEDRPKNNKQGKKKRKNAQNKPNAVSVTISIGVAQRLTGEKDPFRVFKKADEALYAAKGAGRNQVCS